MTKPITRGLAVAGAALLASVVAVVAMLRAFYPSTEKISTIPSPDQRFDIVVYRKLSHLSTMPGQGSDAPGFVRLYDRDGHLLNEAPIDMVQRTNDIEWHDDRVSLPLVFDWKLPRR